MSGSTIGGHVSFGITLGNGTYSSPLTISNSGYIYPNISKETGVKIASAGTVINYGTISGGQGGGYGAYISNGGYLRNNGVISGGYGGSGAFGVVLFSGVSVTNDGTITGSAGANGRSVFQDGGVLTNDGLLSSQGLYNVQISAGTLINNSTITNNTNPEGSALLFGGELINNGFMGGIYLGSATLINHGTILSGVHARNGGTIENSGYIGLGGLYNQAVHFGTGASRLVLDPGATFGGAVVAAGLPIHQTVELASASNAGVLTGVGSSVTGFGNIVIDVGADWTVEGNISGLASSQVISGFRAGDTIILEGFTETSFAYVLSNGLELVGAGDGTTAATIDIAGTFTQEAFTVENVAAGTEILLCYLRGTRILTPAGEVAIEELRIGDAVVTRFGGYRKLKWIGRQSYDRRFIFNNREQIPVCISAGALGCGLPKRDLYVSPGHSMLIDGLLVLAKALVNGVTITQVKAPDVIHYYQLEFETHDCVMAEGAWSESYADTPGLRRKFHNVAEFYALYPGYVAPAQQVLCAPRPMSGPAFERVLKPIVAAAGKGIRVGKLIGCIDELSSSGLLRGWALDSSNPQLPVLLEIMAQGRVIGTVLACEERDDVARAGYGASFCGFAFNSKIGLPQTGVDIRRVADRAVLLLAHSCNIAA